MDLNSLCALGALSALDGSTSIHIRSMEIDTVNISGCGCPNGPDGPVDPDGPTDPDGPGVGVEEPCNCIAQEDPSDPD